MPRLSVSVLRQSATTRSNTLSLPTVNGERMHAPVSKAQWNKMWLSEDMSDYKQRLAAVIFEPFIKKEVKNDVQQQASEKTEETVKPDSPAPNRSRKNR